MVDFKRAPLMALFLVLAVAFAVGCGSDDSAPAAPVVDTVPPAIPAGINNFQFDLSDGLALSWDANVTDPDLAGYFVYRSESESGSFKAMQVNPVSTNNWVDLSAQDGNTYWYRVSAEDASGNESGLSQSVRVDIPSALPSQHPAEAVR